MLKIEKITVDVEGFTVEDMNPEVSADLRDELREKNPEMGQNKFLYTLSSEIFAARVKAWPYSEECNDENKREFFKMFTEKANEIIAEARIKAGKKREELLGNLLNGAAGT